MKALCWEGVNKVGVENLEDPSIQNAHDIVVKVKYSTSCGSDLHLLTGHVPFMEAGDVLGHEFCGEVVEVGPAVRKHSVGDRVVVASFIGCGSCWYCKHDLWSLCDNTNTNPGHTQLLWGSNPGAVFGYSHALGGFRGSHAEYIRVPFGDMTAFPVPEGVSDLSALFASDAAPTGWMGADLGGVTGGDVVAVWGAGAVGQMAARASQLLGAERVVVIDRFGYRLDMVRERFGVETLDYTATDVGAELREMTAGRGPDVCIEAVGCEAHSPGPQHVYDQVKSKLKLETDRPIAVREAIQACRKGGSVFILGVFTGFVDKFPLGALMNKGLTVRGAQQHGQRYIPMLLDRIAAGELSTEQFATHVLPLEDGQRGYDLFKEKDDDCVRAVFAPNAP
ncbi:zinc-dependent alcohol dehydrogenase [Actinokineospora bangkokensis]|uniref:Glutathione-dependent formaldehyde dehydrogenase n=1 Tax=Actinokineospora bangkokensis TaxID=1193682 RepID=A0A1Q9LN86_9PSEU|nr:zinc-dependent alcohol dehydrogenase [Actinokineospora bangkokensis]OLR93490.1 glutathione-dependent formaldehyde dehydrogenase [Actinokineospora bangkokensis]